MKIWAHRGCSQMYPENTLFSFSKAANLTGLTGIELDIQLTKDGYMVVIHDEKVDRTTDGTGYVKDFTLNEIKSLKIKSVDGDTHRIPTIEEVMDLLKLPMKNGLMLNIELKNSVIPYKGMEQKIIDLINARGMNDRVVYSSFSALSIERIKRINPNCRTGMLDTNVSDCLFKAHGCGADDLHPLWRNIDLPVTRIENYTVRAWFTGHLYPEKPTGTRLDLKKLEKIGITDVFLNEPEMYLE